MNIDKNMLGAHDPGAPRTAQVNTGLPTEAPQARSAGGWRKRFLLKAMLTSVRTMADRFLLVSNRLRLSIGQVTKKD